MNGRSTPVFGIPTAVQQLREEFRQDLKAHDDRDTQQFTELRSDMREMRDDVRSLLTSQAAQTAMLTEIKGRRAFNRKLILGLLGSGGVVAGLLHLLGAV